MKENHLSTLLPAEKETASSISFTGDVGRNLTSLTWMLSFLRTRINSKHVDSVIKLASFESIKQFRNQSWKVNLFTESILHLITTSWCKTTVSFRHGGSLQEAEVSNISGATSGDCACAVGQGIVWSRILVRPMTPAPGPVQRLASVLSGWQWRDR